MDITADRFHCLFGSYLIGSSNFWLSYTLLVIAGGAMYAPYGPFFAIIPEILPRNVAGGAMALINSMGALGSFVGSYIVGYLNGVTGGPSASFVFMASALFASVLLTMAVKVYRKRSEKENGGCFSMKIQLALDRMTISEAIETAKEAEQYVDLIEVGTSLIKEYGVESISEIKKEFSLKPVLADMKTFDNATYEFSIAFDAGADMATVMGRLPS